MIVVIDCEVTMFVAAFKGVVRFRAFRRGQTGTQLVGLAIHSHDVVVRSRSTARVNSDPRSRLNNSMLPQVGELDNGNRHQAVLSQIVEAVYTTIPLRSGISTKLEPLHSELLGQFDNVYNPSVKRRDFAEPGTVTGVFNPTSQPLDHVVPDYKAPAHWLGSESFKKQGGRSDTISTLSSARSRRRGSK
jgi:hypothetical protein